MFVGFKERMQSLRDGNIWIKAYIKHLIHCIRYENIEAQEELYKSSSERKWVLSQYLDTCPSN